MMIRRFETFAAHGSFTIELTTDRLIVDGKGPFNTEIVSHYESRIEQAIARFEGKSWSQLIRLHGLSMFTPEAERKLEETIEYRFQRGLTASAVVVGDVEGKQLVMQQMGSIYKRVGVAFDFFDTDDDAHDWLNQLDEN